MSFGNEKRFEDFFAEGKYIALKNHLYNYTVRKHAIESLLARQPYDLILETGSGISPVMTRTERIVYSELSPRALRTLKRIHGKGWYVAADSTRLPFRDGAFSHAISSEVLEHVENDQAAIDEMGRILRPGGRLIVTVPHRRFYFANDDRFVNHFRRYETEELVAKLRHAQLRPQMIKKILGPLEKVTMMATCALVSTFKGFRSETARDERPSRVVKFLAGPFKWANRAYALIARLDARIMPRALAAVILIQAEKSDDGK